MDSKRKLANLTTETRNQATLNIDTSSTTEIVTLITQEDQHVLRAVQEEIPRIVEAAWNQWPPWGVGCCRTASYLWSW